MDFARLSMDKFQRKTNYLQQQSKRQHKKKEIIRLNRDIVYPEDVDFEEIRMIIAARTFDKHGGSYHYIELLNREERPDSFNVKFDGKQLYKNRYGNIVFNETRIAHIMGQDGGFRFLSKHFHKTSSIRRVDE
jgi:hypothetical protein